MIQYINLLSRRRSSLNLVWILIGVLGFAFLLMLGIAVDAELDLRRLRQAEEKTQQSIADLKIILDKKRQEAGLVDSEALSKQIALFRSQIESRHEWADLLNKGDLGNPFGYSHLLETLATVHVDGVWLQGVEVGKGGQTFAVTGKSLGTDAVISYIGRINEALKPMDIQLSSMEITQDANAAEAASPRKAGVLNFKIY